MFWVALLSGMLNCLFLLDFMLLAFTGDSTAELLFGQDNSVVSVVTEYIPGMTPWEFFLANAFVLCFVSLVMVVSIYVAFYSDKRECYIGTKDESSVGLFGSRKNVSRVKMSEGMFGKMRSFFRAEGMKR